MNFSHSVRRMMALCFVVGLSIPGLAAEPEQRAPESARRSSGAPEEAKIDLNTSDLKTLAAVPVIGPDVARAIVAARPFATIDELDRVQGISAERLEQIRAKVMVSTAHVPAKFGMPTVERTQGSPSGEGRKEKVDLNTADLKTLESIDSIGPETARAIVAARPFATLDDLSRVSGISAERLELIRAQVTVAPAERPPIKIPAP